MEYKIISIRHVGSGMPRTDGRYPMRIGRTVDLEFDSIHIGYPMWIYYLKNADGSDYSNMTLRTSIVQDVKMVKDTEDKVIITTMNTIYEFKEVI